MSFHIQSPVHTAAVPPECPQNWYLLAGSSELAPGKVLARAISSTELVLFRAADTGVVSAFSAHCRHAGCHLKHANVVPGGLQCALHHRVIAPNGMFRLRDGATGSVMNQPVWPVKEVLGGIFVFNGTMPDFDLPLPSIASRYEVAARQISPREFDLPWSVLIANGMDIDHLQAIHHRKLKEPPILQRIDDRRMRLSYRTSVTGKHLSDRVMKWVSKDNICGTITCVGGSMMQVETNINGNEAFLILSMVPRTDGGATARGLTGFAGRASAMTSKLRLRVSAWLFEAFLDKDVGVLEGLKWHTPTGTTLGDETLRRMFEFFSTQPGDDDTAKPSTDLANVSPLRREAIQ